MQVPLPDEETLVDKMAAEAAAAPRKEGLTEVRVQGRQSQAGLEVKTFPEPEIVE